MSSLSVWSSRSTALVVLGLAVGVAAPIVISAPATASTLVDVQSHWARPFIEALAQENIVSGYSDRTFRPDQPVTRAQLAAMLSQAFDENNIQLSRKFDRVAADSWASRDLTSNSSSNSQLRPSDQLSRVQVLLALAKGLGLNPSGSVASTLNLYKDASSIPEYARDSVAAATQKGIIVNYPNVAALNPSKIATRADVATFIYQALVNEGVLAPISSRLEASKYIVQVSAGNNQVTTVPSSSQTVSSSQNTRTADYKVAKGTSIKVEYRMSDKVVMTPGETLNMTLVTTEDIKNSRGEVLIPKTSEIEGQVVSRYNGSSFLGAQFVAQRLIAGNDSYSNLNVTSSLVTGQSPTQARQQTLKDAALSTAAQVILGRVIGGGVGVGDILNTVLTGRAPNQQPQQQNSLIIIDPEKDLQLTLGSDLYVSTITKK